MEVAKIDWDEVNFEFSISPFVMADVGIGLTKSSKLKKFYHEGTLIIHADLLPHIFFTRDTRDFYKINLWGIKYKNAYFLNDDLSGFNFCFILGIDSFYWDLPLDPGGATSYNPKWYAFPDLAVGCGYSWKLQNDHYYRISLDAGLKIFISNLYLSYVW